jgi:hypothetical protein
MKSYTSYTLKYVQRSNIYLLQKPMYKEVASSNDDFDTYGRQPLNHNYPRPLAIASIRQFVNLKR